ncbi:MAG: tRNA (mnm(5)s(2)U34)-methyltransferase [Opitutaceae bacterium]
MHLTERVHKYLEQHLTEGALAIDATAGNGHDTLKMAQLVGVSGKVIAIDLQMAAITATKARLDETQIQASINYLQGDHADLMEGIINEYTETAAAITFNLGYLPGSDKSVQTNPASTLRALNASLELLNNGGVLLVTAYRGHEGGLEESKHVEKWMRDQESTGYTIECHEPTANRIPPILWALNK